MSKKKYTPSMVYQSVFFLKQQPLSYDSLPFWIPILDSDRLSQDRPFIERRMVLKCSRQVAKTTNIAILAIGNSITKNNFKTIICQPTDPQRILIDRKSVV